MASTAGPLSPVPSPGGCGAVVEVVGVARTTAGATVGAVVGTAGAKRGDAATLARRPEHPDNATTAAAMAATVGPFTTVQYGGTHHASQPRLRRRLLDGPAVPPR